jgi:hypothetical protein
MFSLFRSYKVVRKQPHILTWHVAPYPAIQEPLLNQLAHVILVHHWYRSTSTCFHVYSREYTCSACCQEFWTSLTQVILGQNWYTFTGTCHHVKNLWFHGKHVATHQICLHNPVNSRTETRELSQLNSWIHLQNMWNHGSLLAGYSCVYQTSHTVQCMYVVAPNVNSPIGAFC